jgi:hypothetical protein
MSILKKNKRLEPLLSYINGLPNEAAFDGFLARIGNLMGQVDYLKASSLHNIAQGYRVAGADLTLAIAEATDWVVTPNMIRPSTFRNPHDGVPLSVFKG